MRIVISTLLHFKEFFFLSHFLPFIHDINIRYIRNIFKKTWVAYRKTIHNNIKGKKEEESVITRLAM